MPHIQIFFLLLAVERAITFREFQLTRFEVCSRPTCLRTVMSILILIQGRFALALIFVDQESRS